MTTNARMSHKDCDHPKTPKARKACREQSLGIMRRKYRSHKACDHPRTKEGVIACNDLRRSDDKGKVCQTCREYKTWDHYSRHSRLPTGHNTRCRDCYRTAKWKNVYGITREQYDELLEAQGGGCWICGTTDPGIEGRGFSVDHDHDKEVVRGLLCNSCNVHTVPGFERLISMGLDPVAAIERYLAQPRIYGKYTENAGWIESSQRWELKRSFRRQILEDHGEFCDICGADEPEGNGWQIDHDHLTDEIRGVTCWPCNVYLMSGVDRLLKMGISLERVLEYLAQDTGIKTRARAKKIVARRKTEAFKELKRASARRRYARQRDERGRRPCVGDVGQV